MTGRCYSRQLRTAHVAALGARTELEKFLTECLSDVKKQDSAQPACRLVCTRLHTMPGVRM